MNNFSRHPCSACEGSGCKSGSVGDLTPEQCGLCDGTGKEMSKPNAAGEHSEQELRIEMLEERLQVQRERNIALANSVNRKLELLQNYTEQIHSLTRQRDELMAQLEKWRPR